MTEAMHKWMHAMRLCLINPSNRLVTIGKGKENRWNRYPVRKPFRRMVLAGLARPEWEISMVNENLGEWEHYLLLLARKTGKPRGMDMKVYEKTQPGKKAISSIFTA